MRPPPGPFETKVAASTGTGGLVSLLSGLARLITPSRNPAGLSGLLAAAYAIVQAVAYGHSIGQPQVWQPALAAFLAFLTRQYVTPVADPRDGNGTALKTANQVAAENFWAAVERGGQPAVLQPPAAGPVTTTGPMSGSPPPAPPGPPAPQPEGTP